MRTRLMLAALASAAILSPAIAQTVNPAAPTQELPYDRGYDKPTARADAINAREGATTDSLNAQADVSATVKTNVAAANQAQYDLDREAYIDALVKHDAAVDRTAARAVRQQRAYADAMAVWRVQVQECKKGHQRACDMPPPSVADYY